RFDETIDAEWRRARRESTQLSLILIDIDHFKRFNDHYGHLGGDDCLRQVASALGEGMHRPGDLVARYGGEEFVVVMPRTDGEGALDPEEEAPAPASLSPTITGDVDGTYNYNFDHPALGVSPFLSYTAFDNSFLLNAAHVALAASDDHVSYDVELDAGSDAAL